MAVVKPIVVPLHVYSWPAWRRTVRFTMTELITPSGIESSIAGALSYVSAYVGVGESRIGREGGWMNRGSFVHK